VGVHEFPVTIEDEQGVLGDRLEQAVELTERIAAYRGLVNLLVHTEITGHKLDFVKGYIERFKDRAWFGTVRDYGRWWTARESVALHVETAGNDRRRILVDSGEDIAGLTLELPPGWRYLGGLEGSFQQESLL